MFDVKFLKICNAMIPSQIGLNVPSDVIFITFQDNQQFAELKQIGLLQNI